MNNKDKEALKDRLSSMGFFDENSYLSYQKAWQAACEYKQKDIDELQAENAKLKKFISVLGYNDQVVDDVIESLEKLEKLEYE